MNHMFLPMRTNTTLNNFAPRWSAIFAAITALFLVGTINDARAQTTVNYQIGNPSSTYWSTFNQGTWGGSSGTWQVSSSEMGMFSAWDGEAITLNFRELRTDGAGGGSVRALQAGDRFSLTLNTTTVRGELGFSLGTGIPGTLNYAARDGNARIAILEDTLNGQFFTTDITSGGANFAYNTSTTRRDYTFNITLTSDTTANVSMTVDGTTFNNFDVILGGAAGYDIDAFSVWLSDDWAGSVLEREDNFVKNISVQNTGQINLGSSLTSGQNVTVGVINDGLAANSTSTVSTNAVGIGGAGQVNLVQSNAYSGATTISNGAFAEMQNAHSLGSTNTGTTVNSGGTLKIWSASGFTTAAEALTISGNGVGGVNGALLNEGGSNTYAGAITLAAASRINATTNTTLTLDVASGSAITGTHNLTFGGNGNIVVSDNIAISTGSITKDGNGRLTISGTQTATGGITVSSGTLFYNSSNSGSGSVTVNSGGTLAGTGSLGATRINSGGTMNPGNSPGSQTYSSLVWEGGGNLNWQLYDAAGAAGVGYDTFAVTGAFTNLATTGSKFNINLWTLSAVSPDANGQAINFTNSIPYTWTLGTFGSMVGFSADAFSINTFSTNTAGGFANTINGTFSISTNANSLLLTYTPTATSYTVTVGSGVTANQDAATGGTNRFTGSGASVTKLGAGTLVMTNSANDYTGSTTIVEGGMSIIVNAPFNSAGALGSASSPVNLGASTNAVAANFNFGAAVTNSREITVVAGNGSGGTRSISTTIGSGTAAQAGNVTFNTNTAITAASGSTFVFSGQLSGSGALNINGAGATVLSGNSTGFSGTITNQNGSTLRVGNNNGLGTGGLILNGGTLSAADGTARAITNAITLNANVALGDATGTGNLSVSNVNLNGATRTLTVANNSTIAGAISGSAGNGLNKAGDGTLTLSGNNSFSGAVDITAGRLNVAGSSAIGNGAAVTVSNGATFGLNALEEIGSLAGAGNVNLGGLLIAGGSGTSTTYSGVISGTDGFVKKGAGTMTLSGSNNYAGETFIVGGAALFSGTSGPNFTNTINLGETNGTDSASLLLGATLNNPLTVRFGSSNNTLAVASSSSSAVTYGGNVNLFNNNFTIGQTTGGTGSVTFGSSTNTFFLGDDGGVVTRVVTVNGSHTIAAQLTGGANNRIAVTGGGTLTLANSNSFSGGAQVTSGTILVGNNAALGTGAFTFNFNNDVGSRVLASSSATAYTLNNDFNVFDNVVTIGQTTGGTGSLTLGGTGKNFNLGSDGEFKSRLLTVNGNHTIAANVTGGVSNNLVKQGLGTLTMSGSNNTFAGGLFIDSGVINLSGGALSGGTVLDIGGGVNGGSANGLDATLRISAASTYGRNITINAETNTSGVAGNRIIEFAQASGSATLSGNVGMEKTLNANVTNANTTGVLSGNISGAGGLTKSGSGSLVLSGSNSFAGNVTISSGTIALTNGNALGNDPLVTIDSGATMAVLSSETLGRFTGAGAVNIANAQTLTTSFTNNSSTFSGQISGAGGLTKAGTGTVTLSGSNSFSGLMQLDEGVLLVGNANALGNGTVQVQFDRDGTRTIASSSGAGFTIANNVNIFNSVTLGQTSGGTGSLTFSGNVALGDPVATISNRNVTVNGNHTISGVISGSNSLTKLGSGTLTLSGAGANTTFTGGAIVSAGTLQLSKSTDVAAINGPITVASTATLLLSSSGNVADTANVTLSGGTIRRAAGVSEAFGNLNITSASFIDFGSTAESRFLDFGQITGSSLTILNMLVGNEFRFDAANFAAGESIANSFSFQTSDARSYSFSSGTFTITAIPEPSTYLAAAGLLAMFLWPARRRLFKDAKSILGLRPNGRDRIEAYRNA